MLAMDDEAHAQLLKSPALKPPPGIHPRLGHPPSLERAGNITAILLLVIIFLLFSMRMYVKIWIVHHIALDDYLLLFAWLVYSSGFTAVAMLVAKKHVAAHQWDLTIGELIDYLKTFHVASILYNVIILPLKVSLILQLLRLFVPQGSRSFTFWLSHTLIWVNVIFYATGTLLLIFACKPEAKIYDPTIKEGHCLDSAAILISTAVMNTVSDILMLFLPQRIIWELNLPAKKRAFLSSIFLVTLLAIGSSLVRLYFATRLKTSTDISYNIGWLGMWTLPEIAIGFLIACLPFTPKFTKHILRKPPVAKLVSIWWPKKGSHDRTVVEGEVGSRLSTVGIVSDAEYDELVARATASSAIKREKNATEHNRWVYQPQDPRSLEMHQDQLPGWPLPNEHVAAVWTESVSSTRSLSRAKPEGIVVTTDVSIRT